MKPYTCSEIAEKSVLALVGELSNSDLNIVMSHLETCTNCKKKNKETEELIQMIKEEEIEFPSDIEWASITNRAYYHWQGNPQKDNIITRLKNSVLNFEILRKLKRYICQRVPVRPYQEISLVFLSAIVSAIVLTFAFQGGSLSDSQRFVDSYVNSESHYIMPDIPDDLDVNAFSFSRHVHANNFAAGLYYANANIACSLHLSESCEKSIALLSRINLSNGISTLEFSRKSNTIEQLARLEKHMLSSIKTDHNELLLYRLGVWSANMLFTSKNRLTGLHAEYGNFQHLQEDVKDLDLPKSVGFSLNLITTSLSKDTMSEIDFSNIERAAKQLQTNLLQ